MLETGLTNLLKLIYMPTMINYGSEMIRINTSKNTIEYSNNQGRNWYTRYTSSSHGTFRDLLAYGDELLAVTDKGILYSNNEGRNWYTRCNASSSYGEFLSLVDNGSELLVNTSKGLYYSNNEGRNWYRRN